MWKVEIYNLKSNPRKGNPLGKVYQLIVKLSHYDDVLPKSGSPPENTELF